MIFYAVSLAIVAFVMQVSTTAGCDMPYLCSKVDESNQKNDDIYQLLQRYHLGTRLHLTLLSVDKSKFDVSEIYKEKIYLVSKPKAPFNIRAANDECKNQGGYLLELDDNDERLFTFAFVEKIGGSTHFAMGGNDIRREGTWLYYSSGKPVPGSIQWISGEPNNSGGNEDCMVFGMPRRGINDIPCTNNMKYVCEVPLYDI